MHQICWELCRKRSGSPGGHEIKHEPVMHLCHRLMVPWAALGGVLPEG